MKYSVLAIPFLMLAGCATGGSGGAANTSASTRFNSPKVISHEDFAKDPKKYSKSWVNYIGGGVDSYKKVTIPSYTLELQTGMYKVGYNKAAALLAQADGAKSSLTMWVHFPWEQHQDMFKEIADASYARLKEKFKKAGVEVVEWQTVASKNGKAAEFAKENLVTTPVVAGENVVSFMAPGAMRLQGNSPYALSALSRDAEVAVFFPNFGVGFGYFDGEATPYTIKEAHGMSSVQFTPQVQVLSGSGFSYQSKWNAGVMTLDNTAVVNTPFVNSLVKTSDSRQAANERGESKRGLAMSLSGAQAHEVQVSTSAGLHYSLDINPTKFKEEVMKQLDSAEDLIVQRYKNEL